MTIEIKEPRTKYKTLADLKAGDYFSTPHEKYPDVIRHVTYSHKGAERLYTNIDTNTVTFSLDNSGWNQEIPVIIYKASKIVLEEIN